MRTATIKRTTTETDVFCELGLDGSGRHEIGTGVGFLDHMLRHVAVHGLFDLEVEATRLKTWGLCWARRWPELWASGGESHAWGTPTHQWTRRWRSWPWT